MIETSAILRQLLNEGAFDRCDPSELLRMEYQRSLHGSMEQKVQELELLEKDCRYAALQDRYRVIDADTRVVVVVPDLAEKLKMGERVPFVEIIRGSVQIYASKINALPCRKIETKRECLWEWTGEYDSSFLGYMADTKMVNALYQNGGMVI
jgi:hypothetical protein